MPLPVGARFTATTGSKSDVTLRALREETIDGVAYVWAVTEQEWADAQVEGREPEATMWPMSVLRRV